MNAIEGLTLFFGEEGIVKSKVILWLVDGVLGKDGRREAFF